MKIQNAHVLVTGSARRIGRCLAERFLKEGARLTGHYHHSHSEAEGLLRLAPGKVHLVSADLSRVSEARKLVRAAEEKFGPIDILVNSASIFFPTPALGATEDEWDQLLDTNLKGIYFLCQAAGVQMTQRGGLILNLADVNCVRPMPNYAPYVISKAGLWMMTRALALEWAPKVRVNSISPGPVLLPENYSEERKERAIERTLLGRVGDPKDIAEAALFLIRNDYVTGQDIAVDGGRSLAERAAD